MPRQGRVLSAVGGPRQEGSGLTSAPNPLMSQAAAAAAGAPEPEAGAGRGFNAVERAFQRHHQEALVACAGCCECTEELTASALGFASVFQL